MAKFTFGHDTKNKAADVLQKRILQSGFTQTKTSRAAPLVHEDTSISTYGSMAAGYSDLNLLNEESYEHLLLKYGNYIWVYILSNKIAEAVNQVDLRVIDKRRKNKPNNEAKGTGMGLIELLNYINPYTTKDEFIETLVLHLLLTGNAYIEKAAMDSRGRPGELYVLNPKNMVVVPHPRTFVAGYQYVVNGKSIPFNTDEIIHIKLPDPRGESHYGMGKLTAARASLDMESHAVVWNLSYFRNATWPSGIIVSKEGMGDEEYKRAKAELKNNYEGSSKVGKILLLEGGLDWKQVTPNPKDLDFLNLRRNVRSELMSLFGVPPSIAGNFEFENTTSRSAGVREQSIFFWSNTVLPILKKILSKLNKEISSKFSENFEIIPDITNIPALRDTEDMKKLRAETYRILVESGWTIDDAKSEMYPERPKFKHGDVLIMKPGAQLVDPNNMSILVVAGGNTPNNESEPDDTPPKEEGTEDLDDTEDVED